MWNSERRKILILAYFDCYVFPLITVFLPLFIGTTDKSRLLYLSIFILVFSVYKIDPVVDYLKTGFGSDSEYYSWLSLIKNRSIHDFGVDLDSNDRVLTLSTCDDTGNIRVVLHAKMISVENK